MLRPLIISLLLLSACKAASILFSSMDQGRSHASSLMPLAHRLKKDNHSVSLEMIMYEKDIDFGVEEEFVDMSGQSNPFADGDFASIIWRMDFTVLVQMSVYHDAAKGCANALKHRMDRFKEISDSPRDLFVLDSLFSPCGYGIATANGGPVIIGHTSDMEPAPGSMKAYARNYGILPNNHMTHGVTEMNPSRFIDRVRSSVEWAIGYFFYAVVWNIEMQWVLSPLAPSFSFTEFHRNAVGSAVDMPDLLFPPAPRTNDIIYYGSYCPPHKKLPEDWLEFVNDPKSKGTIIIAFGTYVDWNMAPPEKVEAFRVAINKLTEYRIVWGYKGVNDWLKPPIQVGDHVRVLGWIPQSALLHHNKTALLITHGGLKSVREAICSAVPAVFMPFFGEQARNAFLVQRAGFAEQLDRHTITAEIVEEKIREMIGSNEHSKAAKVFVEEMMDRPMDALDEAAFKIRRILKKRGDKTGMPDYYYPRGRLFGFVQYLSLDILVAIPILSIIILSS